MKNNVIVGNAVTEAQTRVCSGQLSKGFEGAPTGVLAQGSQLC